MTVGVLILFDLQPIYNTMQFISKIATKISTEWLAFGIVMIGAAIFFKGWQKQTYPFWTLMKIETMMYFLKIYTREEN